MLAAVLRQLAAHQVQRLHAVGALVDHGDAGVADELRHAPFLDVAVAAIDLLRLHRAVEALVGQEALDDGGQQRDQPVRVLVAVMRLVDHVRGPERERPRPFQERTLVHQHPPHVRVDDDRVGRARLVLGPGDGAALQAVAGIVHRVLIGRLGRRVALQPHAQPRLVHHGEHRAHALVQVAQQPPLRPVEVHDAGGVAVDPHLFFKLADRHRLAVAQRAVVVHEELRHDEKADALGAFPAARRLGQHQVDDVVRHVVVAGRDEDLLAGDGVAAVVLRFGAGAQHAQVGAAMRLGQVHGAGPFARHHLGQVGLLLLGRAVGVDRRIGAVGQALVHVEGEVG